MKFLGGKPMLPNKSNYWLTTAQPYLFPVTPLIEKVNVVVIGGGLTGLSAALTLANSGVSVGVLEAQTMGWGASSRNGGMVLTGLKVGIEALAKRYGYNVARRLFDLSLESINTVEKIVEDEKIQCSFSRSGHLELAWKARHFEGFESSAELMAKEYNHNLVVLPRTKLHDEIGSDRYFGGILDQKSAGINPAQFVFGLAGAAEKAGALLYENTIVKGVAKQGNNYSVLTDRGEIIAERVFVGTSGYTGNAIKPLQKRLAPIGSYIIATAPLVDSLAKEVIPNNRMVFDSKNYLYYFRLTPDQRMLFGGRAVFGPETPDSINTSAPILHKSMLDVFPQLHDVSVEYVWGGSLDFAIDSMPHMGNLHGFDYSLGYAGHGVAFATHLGKISANKILGLPVENPLEGLPFQPFPLYNGNPWFLPLAAWYYKMLDLLF